MKSSPNSSTSVVKSAKKSSSSAKVQKLKIKIGSKKGAGKENSNKQPFPFEKLKLKSLSPALALICGKPQMSRHEAVREIWAYIKKQKLQDPGQKTIIFCDEKLKAVTKKKKVTCSEILTCLSQNMTAIKNWIHPATPSDTVYFNFRVSEKMSCEKSFWFCRWSLINFNTYLSRKFVKWSVALMTRNQISEDFRMTHEEISAHFTEFF